MCEKNAQHANQIGNAKLQNTIRVLRCVTKIDYALLQFIYYLFIPIYTCELRALLCNVSQLGSLTSA